MFAVPSEPGHRCRNYRPIQRISAQLRPLSIGESPSRSPQKLAGRQVIRRTELQASFKDPSLPNLRNRSCDAQERRCPRRLRVRCYGPPCNGARRYGSGSHSGRLKQFTGTTASPPLRRPWLRTHMDDSRAPTHAKDGNPPSCMGTSPPCRGRPASDFTLMQAETDVVAQKKRSPETNRPISPRTVPLGTVHRARASSSEPPPCSTSVSIRPPSVRPHTRHTTHQNKSRENPENSRCIWISSPEKVPSPEHRASPRDLRKHVRRAQQGFAYTHSCSVDWGQTWN